MSNRERWSVCWDCPDGKLEAHEPTQADVETVSARLSAWYNESHNRAMMANEDEMGLADVTEHFERVWREGGRNFLLFAQGRLMGDADLRHVDATTHTAEFAIMIGERNVQGRGFGTRFARMVHALAFEKLGLDRIYVSIIPANQGSLRLFEKLGYLVDDSPQARSYIDESDDVTMSMARTDFLRRYREESEGMGRITMAKMA
jgi:RimJ/RimL family protein N-acetyltransferase